MWSPASEFVSLDLPGSEAHGTAGIESPMGFEMRRAAVEQRIPCFTSIDTARVAAQALASRCSYQIRPLVEYRDGAGIGRRRATEVPA